VKEKLRNKFEPLQRGTSMSGSALLGGEKTKNVQSKSTSAPKIQDGASMNGGNTQAYKGLCTYCGIYGHKASNCLKRLNKGVPNGNQNKTNGDSTCFPGICFKCNTKGHKSFDCPIKGAEEGKMSKQDNANCMSAKEIALVGFENQEWVQDRNLWVGDTGATYHMVCDDSKLFDFELVNDEVVVGDGRPLKVTKIGKLKVNFSNSSGEPSELIMDKVKFVPSLRIKLFSLVVGIKKGWKLESEGNRLILSKNGHQILFNKRISMGKNFLLCAEETVKDSLNA
jgi:Zinc knuckle